MHFTGKIIGGILGSLIQFPIGTLIGVWIGHVFDKGMRHHGFSTFNFAHMGWSPSQAQHTFFDATFAVMGHIAKADGTVSQSEIALAEQFMQRLRFSAEQRNAAIASFTRGKQVDFDLQAELVKLRNECRGNLILLQLFVELQQQAAMVDGASPAKQAILREIAQTLNINNYFRQGGFNQRQQRTRANPGVADPYAVLGISASATDKDVKRAYRKKMSENHPDKLVSQGLPEEMMKLAKEKTQAIQAAYEQIKSMRASMGN